MPNRSQPITKLNQIKYKILNQKAQILQIRSPRGQGRLDLAIPSHTMVKSAMGKLDPAT